MSRLRIAVRPSPSSKNKGPDSSVTRDRGKAVSSVQAISALPPVITSDLLAKANVSSSHLQAALINDLLAKDSVLSVLLLRVAVTTHVRAAAKDKVRVKAVIVGALTIKGLVQALERHQADKAADRRAAVQIAVQLQGKLVPSITTVEHRIKGEDLHSKIPNLHFAL